MAPILNQTCQLAGRSEHPEHPKKKTCFRDQVALIFNETEQNLQTETLKHHSHDFSCQYFKCGGMLRTPTDYYIGTGGISN